ncbi:NAD-dependent epimerase [soil metagenome]
MILVTGAAGFIGAHVAARLASLGHKVLCIDNFNDSYAVALKMARVDALLAPHSVQVLRVDCADAAALAGVFARYPIERVVHLAALANVRASMEQPAAFIESNITAFGHVLECCRQARVAHLAYASSSSVYGAGTGQPSRETDATDSPGSLYAATKKSNELMAHAASRQFGLPVTGLRFFTVYGPWGRPDMAPLIFSRAIVEGTPLRLFNHGDMQRDFVYIDDVVDATCAVLFRPPVADADAPACRVLNVGHPPAVPLREFVGLLEMAFGAKALLQPEVMPAGDVQSTWSDVNQLRQCVGAVPATPLQEGVAQLAAWYRGCYQTW